MKKKGNKLKKGLLIFLTVVLAGVSVPQVTVKASDEMEIVTSVEEEQVISVSEKKMDDFTQNSKNDDLPKLAAPTNVRWGSVDGCKYNVMWDAVENAEGEYAIILYKDGEEVDKLYYNMGIYEPDAPIVNHIEEYGSGTYTVKVYARGNKSYADSDCAVLEEAFVYTRPDKVLEKPSEFRWDSTTLYWDIPEDAYKYELWMYCDGEFAYATTRQVFGTSNTFKLDLSQYMKKSGTYTVKVRALSLDINSLASSEYAEAPEYHFDEVVTGLRTELITVADTAKTAPQEAKDILTQMNQSELRAAMQSDTGVKDLVKEIEDQYAVDKNVEVTVASDEDTAAKLDASKVSVVGAALNAAAENSTMTLNFTKPEQEANVESSVYNNIVQMDISLLGVNDTNKLDVPVLITMPIPEGVPADRLCILHFHQDGSHEVIHPMINGDGTVSFSVTSFSVFAFANEKEIDPEQKANVQAFVNRLYTLVLERECDEDGLNSWTNALLGQTSSGVDAGYGFVFSGECIDRNLSDEAFVDMLYKTFMNRDADEGGRSAWVSQLQAGVEREKILEGFIMSPEFAGICAEYGISVGTVSSVAAFEEAVNHYCNQNADVTAFVARCYTEALGREYDPVGLEGWCKAILTQENTPIVAAQSFIFSDEFVDKNLSNEEYIKVLYRTFFGREADPEGLAGWVGVLESGEEDRAKVLDGFANSGEFADILASFGLN